MLVRCPCCPLSGLIVCLCCHVNAQPLPAVHGGALQQTNLFNWRLPVQETVAHLLVLKTCYSRRLNQASFIYIIYINYTSGCRERTQLKLEPGLRQWTQEWGSETVCHWGCSNWRQKHTSPLRRSKDYSYYSDENHCDRTTTQSAEDVLTHAVRAKSN